MYPYPNGMYASRVRWGELLPLAGKPCASPVPEPEPEPEPDMAAWMAAGPTEMADKGTEMVELMTQKGMGKEMSALSSLLVMVYGERGNQGSRGESWRSRPKRGLLFSFFVSVKITWYHSKFKSIRASFLPVHFFLRHVRSSGDAFVEARGDLILLALVASLQPHGSPGNEREGDGKDDDHDDPFLRSKSVLWVMNGGQHLYGPLQLT